MRTHYIDDDDNYVGEPRRARRNPDDGLLRVYHGGLWNGKKPIKVGGRGGYGSGAYFSDDPEVARKYMRERDRGREIAGAYTTYLVECQLDIRNPYEITVMRRTTNPVVDILVDTGMDLYEAAERMEKANEQYGYPGTIIQRRLKSMGYDALVVTYEVQRDSREFVVWNARQVHSPVVIDSYTAPEASAWTS